MRLNHWIGDSVTPNAPSYFLRDLARVALSLLCVLTGHAGKCWLLNRGLRQLWRWACWRVYNIASTEPRYRVRDFDLTDTDGKPSPGWPFTGVWP